MKDHLFVSYASEDEPFAEWLTLKLTSEGYRVWCSKFKLLGGESYPRDIDKAIKEGTFRLLALMSRSSVNKPNPVKERTTALNIAKERKIDFLIPLNVDGISPVELDWMTSDITFVSFNKSWAAGLAQLLKKLESIAAPRPLEHGRSIVTELCGDKGVLRNQMETDYTNILQVRSIPKVMRIYRFSNPISRFGTQALSEVWPSYSVGDRRVISFSEVPKAIQDQFSLEFVESVKTARSETILGIPVHNVISNLISKSLYALCKKMNLVCAAFDQSLVYFPKGCPPSGRLDYVNFKGERTYLRSSGIRRRKGPDQSIQEYPYYLAFRLRVRTSEPLGYYVQLIVRAYVTDKEGNPYSKSLQKSRTKRVLKSWWNKDLLNRQLAICHFLAGGYRTIDMGSDSEDSVVISSEFLQLTSDTGIVADLETGGSGKEEELIDTEIEEPDHDEDIEEDEQDG